MRSWAETWHGISSDWHPRNFGQSTVAGVVSSILQAALGMREQGIYFQEALIERIAGLVGDANKDF